MLVSIPHYQNSSLKNQVFVNKTFEFWEIKIYNFIIILEIAIRSKNIRGSNMFETAKHIYQKSFFRIWSSFGTVVLTQAYRIIF